MVRAEGKREGWIDRYTLDRKLWKVRDAEEEGEGEGSEG